VMVGMVWSCVGRWSSINTFDILLYPWTTAQRVIIYSRYFLLLFKFSIDIHIIFCTTIRRTCYQDSDPILRMYKKGLLYWYWSILIYFCP
jgi:hypothetical protein